MDNQLQQNTGFIDRIKLFFAQHQEKKKLFITLFLLLIIPLTVGAALTIQNLRQRAAPSDAVRFVDTTGGTIATTETQDVSLMITLPSDWTRAMNKPSKQNMSLLPQAYAQTSGVVSGFVRYSSGGGPGGVKVYVFAGGQYFQDTTINGGYFAFSAPEGAQDVYVDALTLPSGVSVTSSNPVRVTVVQSGGAQANFTVSIPSTPTPTPTRVPTPSPTPTKPPSQPMDTPTPTSSQPLSIISCQVNKTEQGAYMMTITFSKPARGKLVEVGIADNSNVGQTDFARVTSWTNVVAGATVSDDQTTQMVPLNQTTNIEVTFSPGFHLVKLLIRNVLDQPCGGITIGPAAQPTPTVTPIPTTGESTAPPKRVLQSITIENKDTDGGSKGDNPRTITANFKDILNKPVKWKLNELREDQSEAIRNVVVTFSDGVNAIPYTATITLARPRFELQSVSPTPSPTATSNEFLVDIIVHESVENQEEAATWAKNAIDTFINSEFVQAGIKHRVRTDKIIKNFDGERCPQSTRYAPLPGDLGKIAKCRPDKADKIRVWLYDPSLVFAAIGNSGYAIPDFASAWVSFPNSSLENMYLLHEIGHVFKLPDYYIDRIFGHVYPPKNQVVPLGIEPYIKDIMTLDFDNQHFSKTSSDFANTVTSLPANYLSGSGIPWFATYAPKYIFLKITDDNNMPLRNVRVEVFAQEPGDLGPIIPNKVTFSGFTDGSGQFELGDRNKLFNIKGFAALLRITKDDQVRYTAITSSYLNHLYFQGEREEAIITRPFSSLVAYDPNKTTVLSLGKTVLYGDGRTGTEPPLSENQKRFIEQDSLAHKKLDQYLYNQTTTAVPTLPAGFTPDALYTKMIECFGKTVVANASCQSADLTGNGKVDGEDYNAYLRNRTTGQ